MSLRRQIGGLGQEQEHGAWRMTRVVLVAIFLFFATCIVFGIVIFSCVHK